MNIMRLIAGGYLVYLGVTLVKDVITNDPENGTFFMAMGVIFIVAGTGIVILKLKEHIKAQYTVADAEDQIDSENMEIEDTDEPKEVNLLEEAEKEENTEI